MLYIIRTADNTSNFYGMMSAMDSRLSVVTVFVADFYNKIIICSGLKLNHITFVQCQQFAHRDFCASDKGNNRQIYPLQTAFQHLRLFNGEFLFGCGKPGRTGQLPRNWFQRWVRDTEG